MSNDQLCKSALVDKVIAIPINGEIYGSAVNDGGLQERYAFASQIGQHRQHRFQAQAVGVPSVAPELKESLQIVLAERVHIEAFTKEPTAQMRHKLELVGRGVRRVPHFKK
jgi:hypothetical protein